MRWADSIRLCYARHRCKADCQACWGYEKTNSRLPTLKALDAIRVLFDIARLISEARRRRTGLGTHSMYRARHVGSKMRSGVCFCLTCIM